MEITERKVSIIDDYGDENWDALSDEIDRCLVKIAKRYGMEGNIRRFMKDRNASNLGEEYAWLKGRLKEMFHKYHRAQKKYPKRSKLMIYQVLNLKITLSKS